MEALKVALGEELFKMCYEEDGHILRVVGGALHDFLNSFNVLLKQSSAVPKTNREDCVNEPSVLCLDKDPGLLTVYFFNPHLTTDLFFPGVIKAAARLLYHTTVDVLLDPPSAKDSILQSNPQPSLLYTVVVKDDKTLSPSPLRATSAGTLPTSLFSTIFPFHLILDQDLVLVQIGHGLRKRLSRKDGLRRASTFQEHFSITSPQIICTFQGILTMLNTQFIIRIKHGASSTDNTGQVCHGRQCKNSHMRCKWSPPRQGEKQVHCELSSLSVACLWLEVDISIIPPAKIRSKCQTISPIKSTAMLILLM